MLLYYLRQLIDLVEVAMRLFPVVKDLIDLAVAGLKLDTEFIGCLASAFGFLTALVVAVTRGRTRRRRRRGQRRRTARR